jgi:hypothetical protein
MAGETPGKSYHSTAAISVVLQRASRQACSRTRGKERSLECRKKNCCFRSTGSAVQQRCEKLRRRIEASEYTGLDNGVYTRAHQS